MSRVGKNPIIVPQGTSIQVAGGEILVKGQKGELRKTLPPKINLKEEENKLLVSVKNAQEKGINSLWGTWRSLIANMVLGVTNGFEKVLEINGVGYRAELKGKTLVLHVGFSHPIEYQLPEGISMKVEKNIITVSGVDKQLVGEAAAQIRKIKKPEPYKGKGIKYQNEIIRRKSGKSLKGASAG
jgi:large subunit ribosomal protein L6